MKKVSLKLNHVSYETITRVKGLLNVGLPVRLGGDSSVRKVSEAINDDSECITKYAFQDDTTDEYFNLTINNNVHNTGASFISVDTNINHIKLGGYQLDPERAGQYKSMQDKYVNLAFRGFCDRVVQIAHPTKTDGNSDLKFVDSANHTLNTTTIPCTIPLGGSGSADLTKCSIEYKIVESAITGSGTIVDYVDFPDTYTTIMGDAVL